VYRHVQLSLVVLIDDQCDWGDPID
jgi:hypothetical protein